jgi:hypothetical protein
LVEEVTEVLGCPVNLERVPHELKRFFVRTRANLPHFRQSAFNKVNHRSYRNALVPQEKIRDITTIDGHHDLHLGTKVFPIQVANRHQRQGKFCGAVPNFVLRAEEVIKRQSLCTRSKIEQRSIRQK